MRSALCITTKVLSGNKIEIETPEAEIGDSVDVIVILPEKSRNQKAFSAGNYRTKPVEDTLQRTAEDIDRQLQEERLSWDS